MIADLATSGTFDGRVALVTGGASGIGQATARLLADRGARVVVADIDRAGAEATVESYGPGSAVAVEVDVTSAGSVDAMVAAALEAFGALDVAVNAAGIRGETQNTADRSVDEWRRMVDVNLTGVFLCLRAELRHIATAKDATRGAADPGSTGQPGGENPSHRRNGEGSAGVIVNVSSGAGEMGVPGLAHYSAAKHGVIGLTKSAALEYARSHVRINAVLPGPIRTPMLQGFSGGDEGVDAMGRMMPVGRAGEPEEVAQAIAWLCSDQASYVTGHMLAVDGGALAT